MSKPPPNPLYPKRYDNNETLFLVYNTSESTLAKDNPAWSEEIEVAPIFPHEVWADSGFASIDGELFYYNSVDRQNFNGVDLVVKFKGCVRNLGGSSTKPNKRGVKIRGFVVAEHHNQIVDAIINVESFVGNNFTDDQETLDWRIRNLAAVPVFFDDHNCPDVNFTFNIIESNNITGVVARYQIQINNSSLDTTFNLDFGDGNVNNTFLEGTHTYSINSPIDPVLTVSNSLCSITVTPTERESNVEPRTPEIPTLEIPVPPPPEIPTISITPIVILPNKYNIPPIVFPCLDVSPTGPINVPSIIQIIPPLNVPSLISITPINIPTRITISPVNIPTLISISPITVNIPTFVNISPVNIPTFISITPINIPSLININPTNIPTLISITPINIPTLISITPINIPTNIVITAPTINIPTLISITPINIPTNITITAPTINIPTVITITSPTINIPTFINIGPVNIPTNITITAPTINIPTVITINPVTIPTAITISPVNIPTAITINPVSIPTVITVSAVNIPTVITVNPVTIPTTITVSAVNIPTVITVNPVTIPTHISIDNSSIPSIIEVKGITLPSSIEITGMDKPIPSYIEVSPISIPSIISFESKPDIPSYIQFSTVEIPSEIVFVKPENLNIPTTISFDIPSNFPTKIYFDENVPSIVVDWNTANVPTVTCIVTVECGSSSTPRMSSQSSDYMELEVSDLGIPSVISIAPPVFPKIKFDVTEIPSIIKLDLVDSISEIKISSPKVNIPSEIKIINESFIPSVISIENKIPETITIVGNLPDFIPIKLPEDFPREISLNASSVPKEIQVVGVPSVINLQGSIPSIIQLVMPEKPEIEMVYRGAPIDVKVQLDLTKVTGDGDKTNCVSIVPCK